jgi:hypothetical protein
MKPRLCCLDVLLRQGDECVYAIYVIYPDIGDLPSLD